MFEIKYKDLFKSMISQAIKDNKASDFLVIDSRDELFNSIKPEVISICKKLNQNVPDDNTLRAYFDTSVKEYLSVNPIDPGINHSLTDKNFKSWLDTNRKKSIEWNYSNRYFEYLEKSGRPKKVVKETEISSLSIIRKMADPKSSKPSYKKGLVVGAVQSGKTGNFNAVINRAIDVGYEMIIVLSGIMEDLRSQTQKRIEKDVVGEGNIGYEERSGKKGVGNINRFGNRGGSDVIQIKSLTSETKDFNKTVKDLDHTLNDKYILVCKKNVSVLKNLIIWLHNLLEDGSKKHNIPLLIIDDEADNASLNNLGAKGRNYASKTNDYIRIILDLFYVKSYVGYTATPFANVLQDRNEAPDHDSEIKYKNRKGEYITIQLARVDNLFPDHFIELLNPPSNYVGAKQIFDTIHPIENQTNDNDKIPLVAPVIKDHIEQYPSRLYHQEDGNTMCLENISRSEWDEKFGYKGYLGFSSHSEFRHGTVAAKKEDPFPKALPESLKIAIKCYIISLAIRQSRIPSMLHSDLYQKHNTMLIHVSRFTLWQNKTKELVSEYVDELINRLNNEKYQHSESIYQELKSLWYSEYGYAHIIENIKYYLPTGYDDEFMSPIVFESLIPVFSEAIKGIEVKAINSYTKDTLDYPENAPKKYIAIGGNRLSRGFTLEGLTINYFTRVTNYSDALLQMGRWFGYRPGYLDCCKIFTTQDTLEKFHETTKCIEELENEFIKMEEQGKAPENFALRVKKHFGTLKITRAGILKNTVEVRWSFQDSLQMTTQLKVDKKNIVEIWDNFKSNIAPKFDSVKGNDIAYFKTSSEQIIEILNSQPNNFNENDTEYMAKFIALCNKEGYLKEWTVGLKLTGTGKEISRERIGLSDNLKLKNERIHLAKRKGPENRNDIDLFIDRKLFRATSSSANITSRNEDLAITLSSSQMIDAREKFYKNKTIEYSRKNKSWSKNEAEKKARSHKTIPEKYYREKMKESEGLIMIYLFDSEIAFNQHSKISEEIQLEFKDYIIDNDLKGILKETPLIGYAIEFPPLENDPGGTYLQGDYKLELDQQNEEDEEYSEEITDVLEGITDINNE
jgi:hypothetical protein